MRPSKKRRRSGAGEDGKHERFAIIPKSVCESVAWAHLSGAGCKVLLLLAVQYTGAANSLTLPLSAAKAFGIRSKGTLNRALRELQALGFVECIWHGGLAPFGASRYALGWRGVREDMSHNIKARPPSFAYRAWKPPEKTNKRKPPKQNSHPHDEGELPS